MKTLAAILFWTLFAFLSSAAFGALQIFMETL